MRTCLNQPACRCVPAHFHERSTRHACLILGELVFRQLGPFAAALRSASRMRSVLPICDRRAAHVSVGPRIGDDHVRPDAKASSTSQPSGTVASTTPVARDRSDGMRSRDARVRLATGRTGRRRRLRDLRLSPSRLKRTIWSGRLVRQEDESPTRHAATRVGGGNGSSPRCRCLRNTDSVISTLRDGEVRSSGRRLPALADVALIAMELRNAKLDGASSRR